MNEDYLAQTALLTKLEKGELQLAAVQANIHHPLHTGGLQHREKFPGGFLRKTDGEQFNFHTSAALRAKPRHPLHTQFSNLEDDRASMKIFVGAPVLLSDMSKSSVR